MARFRVLIEDDIEITLTGEDSIKVRKLYDQIIQLVSSGKEVIVVHRPLSLDDE